MPARAEGLGASQFGNIVDGMPEMPRKRNDVGIRDVITGFCLVNVPEPYKYMVVPGYGSVNVHGTSVGQIAMASRP